MSDDLTQKLSGSNSEVLKQILASIDDLRAQGKETNLRLTNLQQRVDERLHDTRPIWETVTADIAKLQQGQFQIQDSVNSLPSESREVRTLLRDIFRRLSIFNDTLTTIQADYRDIYDRVRGLELRST